MLNAALGTRFQTVLFEIGDDENPVPTEENTPSNFVDFQEARKAHDAVAMAGKLCRDPVFQGWILASTLYADGNDPEYDPPLMELHTAERLREILGIDSRSELRGNSESKKKFLDLQERFRSFQIEEGLDFPFMDE